MQRPIEFEQNEVESLAGNAEALMSWLEQDESVTQMMDQRVTIPAQLILVASTILATGLPVLLDRYLPDSYCWVGGCVL